jgi:hypothetical protein
MAGFKLRAARPERHGPYHLAANRQTHIERLPLCGRIERLRLEHRIDNRRVLLDHQPIARANDR